MDGDLQRSGRAGRAQLNYREVAERCDDVDLLVELFPDVDMSSSHPWLYKPTHG